MKTYYIDTFRQDARAHVDGILAMSEFTRESCFAIIGEVRAIAPSLSALLDPFVSGLDTSEGQGDLGVDVSTAIVTFRRRMTELRAEIIALCPPLIAALEERIVEQRVIEANLRLATDAYLGLPTDRELSEEEQADIKRIAANLVGHSSGDADHAGGTRAQESAA